MPDGGVRIELPKLGVEMEVATLLRWEVDDGTRVSVGDVVATLETDKVSYELEAPAGGVLHRIAAEDTEYPIGALLAIVGDGEPMERGDSAGRREPMERGEPLERSEPAVATGGPLQTTRDEATEARRGEPLASPRARRTAAGTGVRLTELERPPNGVIRAAHVEAAARAARPARPEMSPWPVTDPVPSAPAADARVLKTERLAGMRRTIAQRMQLSLADSAQLTDVREHDVSPLKRFRDSLREQGLRVGYFTLVVKATALALRTVPELNRTLVGDVLTSYGEINVNIAVAVPDGLITPLLRNADHLDLPDLQHRIDDLVARARDRRATREDLALGTFTLTNFGSYGTLFGTPILSPGQVGILGMGALVERPVVRNGGLAIGTVMYTSLTIDHRAVDGESAGRFQAEVGRLLTDPDQLAS
jgi:pyruvate/2-oxoglutarate dehydrogenase complex dihydrolipoamide acyltransferase (E2) component